MQYLSLIATTVWLCMTTGAVFAESNLSMGLPPPLPHRSVTSLSLSNGTDSTLLREPPALQYQAGRALIPFFGFGFSRGTTTDMSGTLMRSIGQQGSFQDERILRDMMGKTMMPNEVQLGIRLPF